MHNCLTRQLKHYSLQVFNTSYVSFISFHDKKKRDIKPQDTMLPRHS